MIQTCIKLKNIVTDEIHYQVDLNPYAWAKWQGAELITDILIYDSTGELIFEKKWDVTEFGDVVEKDLWYYLKGRRNKGIKSNGLVIGTHDGEFGEWVPLVRNFMSDMLLVEASEMQFNKLKHNFEGKDGKKADFNAFVRLRKDSLLWVSINVALGIEAFRLLITPDSVKVLNKLDKVFLFSIPGCCLIYLY